MALPRYLYKYRSIADDKQRAWVRDILVENRLWLPSPNEFNDPYDCFPIIKADATPSEWRSYIKTLVNPRIPRGSLRKAVQIAGFKLNPYDIEENLRNELPKWMLEIGVGSLSASPTEMLMWSHYADSHRGICLRFDTLQGATRPLSAALQVKYSHKRPVLQAIQRDDMGKLAEQAFLRKADCWAYEKEWRLIQLSGPGHFKFPSLALDAVILGPRTPVDHEKFIRTAIEDRKKPTALKRIKFCGDTFSLEVTDELG